MIYLNQITYKYKTSESNNGKLDIIHMFNIPIKIPVDTNKNIDLEKQLEIIQLYDELEQIKNKIYNIYKNVFNH